MGTFNKALARIVLVSLLWGFGGMAQAYAQPSYGEAYIEQMARQQDELARQHEADPRRHSTIKDRTWLLWAVFIGIGFWGFLGVAVMYRRRMTNKTTSFSAGGEISQEQVNALTQSFTTGKKTTAEIGNAVIDALRMGAYANYRRLFPTPREVDQFMSGERAKKYKEHVLVDANMRAAFKRLHEAFGQALGQVERVAVDDEAPFSYGDDPQATLPSIASISLVMRDGSTAVVASMVQLPSGWRLLMPG